jgi:hypothetical protein
MDLNKKNNTELENEYIIDHRRLKKISSKRKKIIGVYFLFYKKELVYIGQSVDIEKRIQEHTQNKVFDEYSYKRVCERDLNKVEKACIEYYNPKLNIVFNKKIHLNIKCPVVRNTATLISDTMHINIDGLYLKSEIGVYKNEKSGFFTYEFKDIIAVFVEHNGSAIIKNTSFCLNHNHILYIFKPNNNKEWVLSEKVSYFRIKKGQKPHFLIQ